jgi:hypothetical protein
LTYTGDIQYLTGFRIDHRESNETQDCRIEQAGSEYAEVIAIERLRIAQPDLFVGCERAIEKDVRHYVENAPVPSSVAVNLVVLSLDGSVFCVERSAATDSAVGWWTVGVFETMKRSDENISGGGEDTYRLAERGLWEELGLYRKRLWKDCYKLAWHLSPNSARACRGDYSTEDHKARVP